MTVDNDSTSHAWVEVDVTSGLLRLAGNLDLASAPVVQAELTLLLREGIGPQVVDLSGLTHLAPAGIEALRNTYAMAKLAQVDVTVGAGCDSVAASVLAAVGALTAVPASPPPDLPVEEQPTPRLVVDLTAGP